MEYTAQQALQMKQAWASYQCQKLFNKHAAMCSSGNRDEEFHTLWSERQDICIGQNDGFWVGRDSVYNAYVTAYENALKKSQQEVLKATGNQFPLKAGSMILHAVSTPLIEVAADLKTAKGMFYSPGYVTTIEAEGKPYARWEMERYAVDFVFEDGWKIWHLFIGVDYTCDVGDRPYQQSPVPSYNRALPLLEGVGFDTAFIPPYDIAVPGLYSSALGWCGYPPEPEAYESFSETFSYGHEPFLNSESYSCPNGFQTTSEARFNINNEVI